MLIFFYTRAYFCSYAHPTIPWHLPTIHPPGFANSAPKVHTS